MQYSKLPLFVIDTNRFLAIGKCDLSLTYLKTSRPNIEERQMDFIKTESTEAGNVAQLDQARFLELSELELVLIGGGIGDTQL